MRRLVPVLCGGVLAAVLSGCASQTITERHLSGIPDNPLYRDKPVIMIFPIFLPFSLGFK
ncbi:MAG: hypothetical protein IJI54_11415 [Kiritimatiellae bacterium]|nr:hypothetical protein [Kiritimatiellia bacterium]